MSRLSEEASDTVRVIHIGDYDECLCAGAHVAHTARKMMAQGNNVSETAYAVGFSDPGYFSKVFRKEFVISPTEYMASLQK